jgi:hypothetical protein
MPSLDRSDRDRLRNTVSSALSFLSSRCFGSRFSWPRDTIPTEGLSEPEYSEQATPERAHQTLDVQVRFRPGLMSHPGRIRLFHAANEIAVGIGFV